MTTEDDTREERQQLDELERERETIAPSDVDTEGAALEEITRGGLPSNVTADVVDEEPATCGALYTDANARTFPDSACSRPHGHGVVSNAKQHFNFNIGWF